MCQGVDECLLRGTDVLLLGSATGFIMNPRL
jgi:hypothetical protein